MNWLGDAERQPIERTVLRREIKEYILQAILYGELREGQRIVETQLAQHLGVSQSPVREALRELEQMGVLQSEPYRGVTVRALTTRDLQEMYRVRAVLEEMAVREATARMDDAAVKEISDIVDGMVTAAEEDDVHELVTLDVSFHRRIVESSENSFLLRMWELAHPASWTFITITIFRQQLDYVAKRHRDIVDAITSRDAKKAAAVVRKHIEEFGSEIVAARE